MPNYKEIYKDIIIRKYPEKIKFCQKILKKKTLSSLDIINLNHLIFGNPDKDTLVFNQKLRSYDEIAILQILADQKINNLTNTNLAKKYNLSRNTVTKWKRLYAGIETS
ncbi:helix-turn-helix domain-containing protein [uncultured Chryseobacterium sp.]|uniref:helix-turn-helix domain-containing protein n=1 Tax=uncultured Chryseobacterium sp. TaxID=259322 RepID=UPI0025DB994A|nr:helix-turn-helix domain-containing protein [uncultured Chryseobacterium sp.]